MKTKRTAHKRTSGAAQSSARGSARSLARSSARGSATSEEQRLLKDQREANEQLVRTLVQMQEMNDAATAAQDRTKRLLQQMIDSENELLAIAHMRERLLGMVGHDLRNPLSAVSMCVEFLARRRDLGDEVTDRLRLIQKSLNRMDHLILQLYDFTCARLGGGVQLSLSECDLRYACSSAIEELSVTSAIPIRQELRGDLTGTWDEERLVEALSNLIGNALEHAAENSAVLVTCSGESDEVIIEVTNLGEPIPPALLPVLFEAFHRGVPDFRAKPGHLGLGLFIAHEIVRAHGGTLSARCADGATTFTLRLPRAAAQA